MSLKSFSYYNYFFLKAGLVVFITLLCLSNAFAYDDEKTVVVDAIVASVDDEPITRNELRRFVDSLGFNKSSDVEKNQEVLKQALHEMIALRLYEKEASSLGVVVEDDDIEAYIEQVKQQNKLTDEQFLALLKSKGLSLDDYKAQIKGEICKTRVMQSKVQSSVQILDEDINRFVAENPKIAPKVGDVHLFQIMVEGENDSSSSRDGSGAVAKQCADYRSKLKNPAFWQTVGGDRFSDVGYVSVEELRDELRDEVLKLKEREVSEVITTPDGCYLVMIVSRATEPNLIDKEQREQIKNKLYQDKVQERLREFVTVDLPKKYHVKLIPGRL